MFYCYYYPLEGAHSIILKVWFRNQEKINSWKYIKVCFHAILFLFFRVANNELIASYSFLTLFPPCFSWKGNLCPYLLATVPQIGSPEWRFVFGGDNKRLKRLYTRSPLCPYIRRHVHTLPRLGLQTLHSSTLGRGKGTDFQGTGLDWP